VKILDTNLWVFGTLGHNSRAERLLDEIDRGETASSTMSARTTASIPAI